MASSEELLPIERASLLLLALGHDRAGNVLKHIEERDVQLVGSTMATLKDITPAMIDVVLEDFIVQVRGSTAVGIDSSDFIRSMLTNALGSEKADSIADQILFGTNSKGIEQLKWMESRAIADLIRLEHPQIITILLSLLDSDQATEVLGFLPKNTHSDLMMRIASLESVQPSALRELDSIMDKRLSGSRGNKTSSLGGIDTVANMFNFMDGAMNERVMEEISNLNAELAQQIQDKLFVFEDLGAVDDRGLQTLMREISTDQLLLALRGVDDALKDKILNNMSKRAAEMLRDDLAASPPAKLSDVESAQKEILSIAKKLADAGQIMLGSTGGADALI